jgi:hypothetical protein
MMSLNDQDLELLEAYVDGELDGADDQELRHRLDSEPALSAALETLRAEAHVRAAVWKGYEPDEQAIRRLIARIDTSVDRNTIWAHRLSKIRMVSAAAACVVLGLLLGRISLPGGAPVNSAPSISNTTSVDLPLNGQPRMVTPDQSGPVRFRIVDDKGNPIAIQPFKSSKQADEFLRDLASWQRSQAQLRTSGTTMPSSGQF